jgi:hypothetical protein
MSFLPKGIAIYDGIIKGLLAQPGKFNPVLRRAQNQFTEAFESNNQGITTQERVQITTEALSGLSNSLKVSLPNSTLKLLERNLGEFLETDIGKQLVELGLPVERAVLKQVKNETPTQAAVIA